MRIMEVVDFFLVLIFWKVGKMKPQLFYEFDLGLILTGYDSIGNTFYDARYLFYQLKDTLKRAITWQIRLHRYWNSRLQFAISIDPDM